MAYYFYLDEVQLPIAPSKLQTKIKNQNKTITLINESEVNQIKPQGLTEVSFDVILPGTRYPFVVGEYHEPIYYLNRLRRLKDNKKPFLFNVTRLKPNGTYGFATEMSVTLESYTVTEEGQDYKVSIDLKQYVNYKSKKLEIGQVVDDMHIVTATEERSTDKTVPNTYTVVSGDTMMGICKKIYGDSSLYSYLATYNGIANPNFIYSGQVLKLAEVEALKQNMPTYAKSVVKAKATTKTAKSTVKKVISTVTKPNTNTSSTNWSNTKTKNTTLYDSKNKKWVTVKLTINADGSVVKNNEYKKLQELASQNAKPLTITGGKK